MPENTIPAVSIEFQPFLLGVAPVSKKGHGHGTWEVSCSSCGAIRTLRSYKNKVTGRVVGDHHLCPACTKARRYRQVDVKCPVCGKTRMMSVGRAKHMLSSFCRLCASRRYQTRNTTPGHSCKTWNGYVLRLGMQNHPIARHKKVIEHWLVLYEQHPMGPEQVLWFRNHDFTVHHKNGIRDDNRLENLELRARGKHPNGWTIEEMEEVIRRYRSKPETAGDVTRPPST